jgi:rhodanese-related sulfurtransferase
MPEVQASEVPDGGWLLDVREPHEWVAGHAPTATHIPMAQLAQRAGEVPQDNTVYVICRSGVRSAHVAAALAKVGRQAVNVADGMRGWAAAGRPMISETGSTPTVA